MAFRRPFAPPSLQTPPFLPSSIYPDQEDYQLDPYSGGSMAPPALSTPPQPPVSDPGGSRSARNPLDRYDALREQRPQRPGGVRGAIGSFFQGGLPGLGYQLAMGGHRNKQAQYDEDMERESERIKIEQEQAKADAEVGYRGAAAEAQRQHGEYWKSKAGEATDGPKAEAVGAFGYYDRQGTWHDAPQRDPSPPSTYEAMLVRVASDPNAPPEKRDEAQKKLDALRPPPLPAREPNPTAASMALKAAGGDEAKALRLLGTYNDRPRAGEGAPRMANRETFSGIESRKNEALRRAETDHLKRTGKDGSASGGTMEEQESLGLLDRQKMQIQQDYLGAIKAAGGSDGATPPQTPAPPQAQAPQGQQQIQVGQTVRLRNGTTVRVTAVNPDGTFDYE